MKKRTICLIIIAAFVILIIIVFFIINKFNIFSQKKHSAADFNITVLKSETDIDNDNIDDYTDILQGAKNYINTKPKYKSEYYDGGYPNDGYGVCTDVIWNAFENAGYNIKDLVDEDILENTDSYTTIEIPDPNIDFRRVKNLKIFFDRNAEVLTTELTNPQDWQAGDIVIFTSHIAICSDIRNSKGIPFIIHHDSMGARERNDIDSYTIVGHYRWNISN